MGFPEKLYNLRKKTGLSQKELANKLGVAQASINYWEKGQRTPSIDMVTVIADYFNVSVDYLTTGEESDDFTGYYLNDKTARLAQEMFEDEDMRSLFDMKRNMPPERFQAHMDFMKNLYNQEKGTDI